MYISARTAKITPRRRWIPLRSGMIVPFLGTPAQGRVAADLKKKPHPKMRLFSVRQGRNYFAAGAAGASAGLASSFFISFLAFLDFLAFLVFLAGAFSSFFISPAAGAAGAASLAGSWAHT